MKTTFSLLHVQRVRGLPGAAVPRRDHPKQKQILNEITLGQQIWSQQPPSALSIHTHLENRNIEN
jgi:hypothetical protein